jgi:heme o synthase
MGTPARQLWSAARDVQVAADLLARPLPGGLVRTISPEHARGIGSGAWDLMRSYLRLCKLRVTGLLVVVAVVAAVVSSPGPAPAVLVLLALSGGLACVGSAFLNHYFDRDIDGLMGRTCGRPLPAGRILNDRAVFYAGLGVLAVGALLALLLNPLTAVFTVAGAAVYVLVYTLWLKRRSPFSSVVGGLSGSFAALAGWAATGSEPSLAPFLVALVVFLWTPPHFWSFAQANRADYERAGIPTLPVSVAPIYIVGSAALLVAVSIAAYLSGATFGLLYLGTALVMGGIFLRAEGMLLFDGSRVVAWRAYKLSGVWLLVLLMAMTMEALIAGGPSLSP